MRKQPQKNATAEEEEKKVLDEVDEVAKACETLAQQFLSASSVAAFFRFIIMRTGICVAFAWHSGRAGECVCVGVGVAGCIIYMLLMISLWFRKQFLMISYDSIMHSIRSRRCCCCMLLLVFVFVLLLLLRLCN